MSGLKKLTVFICIALFNDLMLMNCTKMKDQFCLKEKDADCKDNWSIRCGPDRCSTGKEACDYLNSLYVPFNSFVNMNIHQKSMLKYRAITSQLNVCPDLKWHSASICSNYKCATAVLAGQSKSKQCLTCSGSHPFTCGRYVCTVNKKECDVLKFKLNKKSDQIMLRSCQIKVFQSLFEMLI